MMRAPARERGGRHARNGWRHDLPAEHVAVERDRTLEVADVKHQVAELFDFHRRLLSNGSASRLAEIVEDSTTWSARDLTPRHLSL
jgi:hypothetical protein